MVLGAIKDVVGGDPAQNAEIVKAILKGEKGPKRDTVLFNAGAALYAADRVKSIADGITLAAEMIDSGKAYQTLETMIEVSNS